MKNYYENKNISHGQASQHGRTRKTQKTLTQIRLFIGPDLAIPAFFFSSSLLRFFASIFSSWCLVPACLGGYFHSKPGK
jgi:hypothetical protein